MWSKQELYTVVFGTETKAGRRFDVVLLWVILFSVSVVMLESVPSLGRQFSSEFWTIEWVLTMVFSIEFILRLWISPKPIKYLFSFWGVIDLLSILPTYISFFVGGYHYLLVVRIFRLLRIFRVLKLVRFSSEARVLIDALKISRYKISIFLLTVVAIATFMGTIMYVVEGSEKGFTSIPQSIYWAIVTITTVGYGDMVPHSVLGKIISSISMILGYAIIAVPTGIVTVGMSQVVNKGKVCEKCHTKNKLEDNFCGHCGEQL